MPPKSIAAAALLVGALILGGGVALATEVTNTNPSKPPTVAPHTTQTQDTSETTATDDPTDSSEATETTEATQTTEATKTTQPPGSPTTCAKDNHGCAVSRVARDRSDPANHAAHVRAAAHDRSTLPAGAQH